MPLAALNRAEEFTLTQTRDQRSRVFVLREIYFMSVRGIRGATTVTKDEPQVILQATSELLAAILDANPSMKPEDIASVLFTLTEDLRSEFPAKAAREMGWERVPLMCAQEIPVPGGLPACIRVLIHWNTDLPGESVRHIYLRKASKLREDLANK